MAEMILMIVLLVLVVALFVISYLKKKKFNTNLNQLREELKNGDKVMTDSGIVGEVVDSYEEEGYKYFVLKSGKGDNVGYYSVHANAIYYVFGKDIKDNNSEKITVKVEPKSDN
ncbi:MAG: preprotein translocase subunit YajC [Clostridia bacterium]